MGSLVASRWHVHADDAVGLRRALADVQNRTEAVKRAAAEAIAARDTAQFETRALEVLCNRAERMKAEGKESCLKESCLIYDSIALVDDDDFPF